MSEKILGMIGLCRRAGMLAAGEEPAEAVCRAKDARVLLLASDAADNTARRVRHFAEEGACLWLRVPFSKAELGRVLGRSSCAIAAITDVGFAASIVRRLSEENPALYAEAADKLELKAKRALERKEELRAHEKNVRAGKRRDAGGAEAKPRETAAFPRPGGDHPRGGAPYRGKSDAPRPGGDRPRGGAPYRGKSDAPRPDGDRPRGGAPYRGRSDAPRSDGDRPRGGAPYRGRSDAPTGKSGGGHARPLSAAQRPTKPTGRFAHSQPVKKGKGSRRGAKDG